MGFVLEIFPYDLTRELLKIIEPLLRLWPIYCFGEALRRILMTAFFWRTNPPEDQVEGYFADCVERFAKHEVGPWECSESMFSDYSAGAAINYMIIESVVYFFLVILIDYLQQDVRFRQWWEKKNRKSKMAKLNMREWRDADVVNEENRLANFSVEDKKSAAIYLKKCE